MQALCIEIMLSREQNDQEVHVVCSITQRIYNAIHIGTKVC